MKCQELLEYINCGRELEFLFNGKKYSITYGKINGEHVISFCEFFKETTEVTSAEALLNVKREGISVLEMWESLSADDLWIY